MVQLVGTLENARDDRGIYLIGPGFDETFHSYNEIHRRVLQAAGRFNEQGVRPGQRVLLALDAEIETICAFLALIYMGAVPFSVPPPLMGQDRDVHRRRIGDLVDGFNVEHVLSTRTLSGVSEDRMLDGRSEGPSAGTPPAHTVEPDDVAIVQFSSGTTANPKGVQITHRNLVYNTNLFVENDRRTEDSVWVSWLPLCHDMGLVGGLLTNFLCRNTLVLMHPRCFVARPISWLDAVSRHRGTVTATPNFGLDMCTNKITDQQLEEHAIDLGTFRYIYNGSEPVRAVTMRRFVEKFEKFGFVPDSIRPGYGMAEATLMISISGYEEGVVTRWIDGTEVPAVGYPCGDFEIRIRNDEGADLETDRVGEIWIRGTSVTPGYLGMPGEPTGVIRDGWLATGDLGLLDEGGRLFITGRKKDLIIYHGRNFYGHEIAARICELPFIKAGKVHVFGTEVDGREEIVVMMVAPEPGQAFADDPAGYQNEVRRLVMREFGIAVHDFCIVPEILKTTSGKVARHRCEEVYLTSLQQQDEG